MITQSHADVLLSEVARLHWWLQRIAADGRLTRCGKREKRSDDDNGNRVHFVVLERRRLLR